MRRVIAPLTALLVFGSASVSYAQPPAPAVVDKVATVCTKQIRIWYDSDQFGTYPKAWGELQNCGGPRAIRARISCIGEGIKYDKRASSSSAKVGTTVTPVGYIGFCKKGWFGDISGSVAGFGFTGNFWWKDWGYPT